MYIMTSLIYIMYSIYIYLYRLYLCIYIYIYILIYILNTIICTYNPRHMYVCDLSIHVKYLDDN